MGKLKRCPMCGGEGIISPHTLVTWIKCRDCYYIISGDTEQEAIDIWNEANRDLVDCDGDACDLQKE